MAAPYATSYDQGTVDPHAGTNPNSDSGIIDKAYVKSIHSLLKLLEMVFGLVAFILVVAPPYTCILPGANGWFGFVTMFSLITTLLLYVLLIFKLQKRIFRCDCIVWPAVEMVYYTGVCVLLFIADVVLSVSACSSVLKAGVAFGWFTLAVYGVDLCFSVRLYMTTKAAGSSRTANSEITENARY